MQLRRAQWSVALTIIALFGVFGQKEKRSYIDDCDVFCKYHVQFVCM